MEDNTKMVQAYIEKMMQIQDEQQNKPLSQAELKEIAFELGMTDEDWEASQQVFRNHLANGQGHLIHQNWADAAVELQQANSINPYNKDVLYGLARAYQGNYVLSQKEADKEKAIEYVNQCLRVSPGNSSAIKVKNALIKAVSNVETGKKKKKVMILTSIAVGVVLLVLTVFIFQSSISSRNQAQINEVIDKKEMVKQKWAQVENVYQRRADLIPQVVKVVKKSKQADQRLIDKLLKAYKATENLSVEEIKDQSFEKYHSKQQELTTALNRLVEKIDENESELLSELLAQIEGADNRIAVERKKYNEAVGQYNTLIQKNPYNKQKYKPIPYFKMNKGADKKPEIDF